MRQSSSLILRYTAEVKRINFAKRLNSALSGIFAPRARKKRISRTPTYKAAENFDGIPGYLTQVALSSVVYLALGSALDRAGIKKKLGEI